LVVEKKRLLPHTSYSVSKVAVILDDSILIEHYGYGYDEEIHSDNYSAPIGSRSWREGYERYQEDELITPEEAVKEIQRLNDVKDILEKEFEGVRSYIQDKLDQAAGFVKQAGEIAKSCDKSLFDLKPEGQELYKALEDAGWSHSHMSC